MVNYLIRTVVVSLLLLVYTVPLTAQVNIIFNAGALGKDMRGLSGVQIINSSAENYTGNMDIEVKNPDRGVLVVKVLVSAVSIKPGNNIIPYTKFSAASVLYANTTEGNFVKQTGQMPEGELEYCFKLTVTAKNNLPEIFDNCFLGTNIVAGPLELILPDNGDNFCEKRPRFNWQPPMPLTPGTSFTIKLARKNPGQSQAEALLVNPPVFYQANLKGYIFPYPAGSPDLKEGTTYVWQVTAASKGKQSLSEVWEFTIQCEKQETTDRSFRELKAEDDGGFLSTGPSLRFAVFNPYMQGVLKYSINDLNNPDKKIKRLPLFELQKGSNNILLDLKKIPGMEDGNEYQLVVVLPDGRKVSLRFKYQEEDE